MAFIKLKQEKGEYTLVDKSFRAGHVYEVDNKTAFYLVQNKGVAVEVDLNAETKKLTPATLSTRKIALIRIGGIGDALILSGLATAVKRKYPDAETTLMVRDLDCMESIKDNPAVNKVVCLGNISQDEAIKRAKRFGFEIIYDNRYVTRVYHENGKYEAEKGFVERTHKPYKQFFDTFPLSNNSLSKNANMNERSLMFLTAGIEGSDEDIVFPVNNIDTAFAKMLGEDKFVTVHNGSDFARSTKAWRTEYWEAVVAGLKERGFRVVQLGKRFEEPIKGAIDMTGSTTIRQTAGLISKASFHIDTEGGLVHLAWAVRTRSIVLFGATPKEFFHYEENIAVESPKACKGCWWTSDMWWRECPQRYNEIECMKDLTPESVLKAVDEIVDMKPIEKVKEKKSEIDVTDVNERFAMELILDENHYRSEPHQWERIYAMMALVKGRKVLEVGAGDGYCVEVLKKQGYEVSALEISKIRLDRMKRKGINAVYGNITNLPYADGYFDTVICGEVLEHLDSMGEGLRELERVCKPDGRIIISLPVAPVYRDIKMHLWGISHHPIMKDGKVEFAVLSLERINRNG